MHPVARQRRKNPSAQGVAPLPFSLLFAKANPEAVPNHQRPSPLPLPLAALAGEGELCCFDLSRTARAVFPIG